MGLTLGFTIYIPIPELPFMTGEQVGRLFLLFFFFFAYLKKKKLQITYKRDGLELQITHRNRVLISHLPLNGLELKHEY